MNKQNKLAISITFLGLFAVVTAVTCMKNAVDEMAKRDRPRRDPNPVVEPVSISICSAFDEIDNIRV